MDDVGLDCEVVADELRGIGVVSMDAAHLRPGQVHMVDLVLPEP